MAVLVGFHCDVISCEVARHAAWSGKVVVLVATVVSAEHARYNVVFSICFWYT